MFTEEPKLSAEYIISGSLLIHNQKEKKKENCIICTFWEFHISSINISRSKGLAFASSRGLGKVLTTNSGFTIAQGVLRPLKAVFVTSSMKIPCKTNLKKLHFCWHTWHCEHYKPDTVFQLIVIVLYIRFSELLTKRVFSFADSQGLYAALNVPWIKS